MKLMTFLLVTNFLSITANTFSQNGSINMTKHDASIKEVLTHLEKLSNYKFLYRDEDIENKTISLDAKNWTIDQVLSSVLTQKGITFKKLDNELIVIVPSNGKQQLSISGKITDASNGEPMTGVNVLIKGTTKGVVTDANGNYTITLTGGNETLEFSFIGYISQKIVVGSRSTVDIVLAADVTSLEEVVVIGYGAIAKKDVTGAVTSLDSKSFNAGMVSSPTEMMQGRIAGVNITSNGGEPGVGAVVRIRGSNSIRSGQDPLYVIDGVPLDITDEQPSGADITGAGSNAKKNPLNFINPDDIETVDVLKDASATAIYGSRGANGVILITTKKGKGGKSTITYSNYYATSSLPKELPMLSAKEFVAFRTSAGLTGGDYGSDTNWQDQIFRTTTSQNHNFSIAGGDENSKYRASVSYLDEKGIVKSTGMEKYTGRLNFTHSAFSDRVKFEGGLTVARVTDKRVPIGETGGYEGDVILSALKLNPTAAIYNTDGTYNQLSSDVRNPVAMINLTNDKTQNDRIIGNFSTSVNILKGLSYKINLAFDQSKAERKVVQDAQLSYLDNGGSVDIHQVDYSSRLIENFLTYETTFHEKHSLKLLAGHSYQKFKSYSYGFTETGFEKGGVNYLNDLELGNYTEAITSSGTSVNELQSYFGRINYGYASKYLLTATLRADGSTKFGDNNKYGYFPSASVAWRISQEHFFENVKYLSDLKLRAGWGIIGNQEIPNKISQISLGSTNGAILDGSSNNVVPGITLTRTPNPNIKWEQTKQVNIGLDFAFFKNRLTGTFDYYNKKTGDVLLEVTSIAPAPTTTVWSNVPNMIIHNHGYELGLNGVAIEHKGLRLELGGVIARSINKVTDLPLSQISTGYPSGPSITSEPSQVIMSGQSIGTFYGRQFLGFDASGNSIFEKDASGNDLKKVLGSAMPDFTYSFNASLYVMGFDFSVFLNGVQGNKVYNNLGNIINQKSLLSKEWNATKSAIQTTESLDNSLLFSSRFIEDGSFLRLQNATLGYSFNTKQVPWITKLRVYVSGNNLLLFTNYSGYDPEVSADHSSSSVPSVGIDWTQYPKARTFTAGVNVEF